MVQGHGTGTPAPRSLQELLARYLERQTAAHAAGLGEPLPAGDFEPFDAVPARPVDARVAWTEAVAVLRCLLPDQPARIGKPPVDWSTIVAGHEPVAGIAFALGNFPQLVRDLNSLWQTADLSSLKPAGNARVLPASDLADWAGRSSSAAQKLLAIGVLRLARQFDRAAELLDECRKGLPAELQPAWGNESAALLWHRGCGEEALAAWRSQPESVPVLFNRGMAAMFLGQTATARSALEQAARQLPEDSAWHHLAALYLALAEARG